MSSAIAAALVLATPQVQPPEAAPVAEPTQAATPQLPVEEAEPRPQDDVVVRAHDDRGDPMAGVNAQVLQVAEGLDKAVIGPAAMAYEKKVPGPLRSGLRNFLNNLREPIVFANFLLQLKFGKAGETAGRFAINSTLGVAGVMDMAKRKPFRLPLRRNSFANTLGFYGVHPGPFFFLPLVGPTTLRDLLGTVVDQAVIPIQPIRPSGSLAYSVPVGVLSALDYRVRIAPDLERQRDSGDPYRTLRADYLAKRQAEIDRLRGKRPDLPLPTATDSPYAVVPR